MIKSFTLIILLSPTCIAAPSLHNQAEKYLKHQKLMVGALKEILNADTGKYCKELTPKECAQLKNDQQELYKLLHEAGKPYSCEQY